MPRSASSHKEGDDGRYCDNGPGDRDRKKASRLATHLAKMLDPTTARVAAPTRTVELRVIAIDISIKKGELRQALTHAAGCGGAEVQVGKISTLQRWPRVSPDQVPRSWCTERQGKPRQAKLSWTGPPRGS